MNKKITFVLSVIALVPLLFMSGCATMNQSECQVANWEIIGLEDASAGRPSSYIGQHRSACADYGIAPDLEKYMVGYNKGLNNYCTKQNGYNQGAQGMSYAGICPANLASGFLAGYRAGKEEYDIRTEIASLKSQISHHYQRLETIERQIKRKEDEIVAPGTTSQTRRRLLEEIESLRSEQQAIELEIPAMEDKVFRLEEQYARITRG